MNQFERSHPDSPLDVPNRTGVLLVNLGTPDAPTPRAVRRYLREFLGDPRVLTLPAPIRWLLLHLVILPTRPRRTAAAYRAIWSAAGSPLLAHSLALRDGVARELGSEFRVELGMRYGSPSIAAAVGALERAGIDRLLVLPLFPQYASSVTSSAAAELTRVLAESVDFPPLEILGPFYDEPEFVASWAAIAGPGLAEFAADHVLFSFHGLPEDQIRTSDRSRGHCLARPDCCSAPGADLARCYRAQCFRTAENLRRVLELPRDRTSSAFQSRLGPTPWIQPFTDHELPLLRQRGIRRLAVFCPSFVADCLETLEEVGIRLREQWQSLGGEALWLAPCPNGDPRFAAAVASWLRRR
ncbi:ferrochelatase [Myxococcota bacterium]|nr:ferrochelatase [Myxococcota bacterium]